MSIHFGGALFAPYSRQTYSQLAPVTHLFYSSGDGGVIRAHTGEPDSQGDLEHTMGMVKTLIQSGTPFVYSPHGAFTRQTDEIRDQLQNSRFFGQVLNCQA